MPRLAVILFLAAPAFAEDFETRYHEAYKLEVVDGKVADAATRYLDLLTEKELPAHLRAQSEFRFAVTCALLGRPDEARARLAALAAAPGTPAALQPQIEEYRKSLADMAPGSAASKRIEELVFQLGREVLDYDRVPAVYRDFEILGAAAVPHLRRLLDHPDPQLREHAFRILCRMNEPGLAARWNPKWESVRPDFGRYLAGRPEETAILEERLAAMPAADVDRVLDEGRRAAWSATFLKAYAARVEEPDYAVDAAVARQDDPKNRELLATWLGDGPDAFAWEVASAVAYALDDYDDSDVPKFDVRLFPAVSMRLARTTESINDDAKGGIRVAADGRPTDVLLDVLAALLDAKDASRRHAVAEPIACALARRATDEAQTRRFAALLDVWMSGARPPADVVRVCAERLPTDQAARLVGKWYAREGAESLDLVALKRPEDVALLRAALDAMEPERRRDLFNKVFVQAWQERKASSETCLAMARLLPLLFGKIEAKDLAMWTRLLAPRMTPDEGTAAVVDLVRKDASFEVCNELFRSERNTPDDITYRRDVVVRALPSVWEFPRAGVRSRILLSALQMLDEQGPRALDGEHRKELAAFLLPRLGEMLGNDAKNGYPIVARHPGLFPLEEWLPNSPQSVWQYSAPFGGVIDQERLDRAARALIADPSKPRRSSTPQVTDTVLTFLECCVSGDVSAECAAQLYREADVELLAKLLAHRNLMPGDTAVLEETFDRVKDADLAVVARLGFRLAEVRPSEKLYGLAERLLASPERGLVLEGIELARSLGRDALVPALLAKLDSMDSEVRTKAREAIDSILDLKRIKDEVAERVRSRKLEEAGFK